MSLRFPLDTGMLLAIIAVIAMVFTEPEFFDNAIASALGLLETGRHTHQAILQNMMSAEINAFTAKSIVAGIYVLFIVVLIDLVCIIQSLMVWVLFWPVYGKERSWIMAGGGLAVPTGTENEAQIQYSSLSLVPVDSVSTSCEVLIRAPNSTLVVAAQISVRSAPVERATSAPMSDRDQSPSVEGFVENHPSPKLLIKVIDDDDNETFFKVKRNSALSKLMKAFCEHQGKAMQSVRFRFDGSRVNPLDSPASLEMVDGDTIEVHQEPEVPA